MITGKILKDSLISGANNIKRYKKQVDELNVFPVPDGDTGTNMYMTISAASKQLESTPDTASVGEVAKVFADALLRGARGNSGVILSLIFRGFSKYLVGKIEMTSTDIAGALEMGVKSAYDVVMKPTEGTILTVVRKSAEYAKEIADDTEDVGEFWNKICDCAKEVLDLTPTLLPVLKKAGVVDAGGKGLLVIFEGMLSVFKDGIILGLEEVDNDKIQLVEKEVIKLVELEADITFTYCTEFIINKDKEIEEVLNLRAYLESMGDSVVVVDDDSIIKVHIHTDDPGKALTKAVSYGQLTNIKIDNMREQCKAQEMSGDQEVKGENEGQLKYVPVDVNREYGFVTVAAGEGIHNLFKDLGVDNIVNGGQTMNPSTDDILNAIHATPAKTVFVLPNNKNIIMAAEQAVHMADRSVCVLQSRTIAQGLSAMLSFDVDKGLQENQLAMTKAIDNVGTGQITFAARDSDFEGHKIKSGDLLALENGVLSFTERNLNKACLRLIKGLLKKDSMFVTVMYGIDVSNDQVLELELLLKSKLSSHIEINLINGGQPVYYYIISVE